MSARGDGRGIPSLPDAIRQSAQTRRDAPRACRRPPAGRCVLSPTARERRTRSDSDHMVGPRATSGSSRSTATTASTRSSACRREWCLWEGWRGGRRRGVSGEAREQFRGWSVTHGFQPCQEPAEVDGVLRLRRLAPDRELAVVNSRMSGSRSNGPVGRLSRATRWSTAIARTARSRRG